MIVFTLLFPPIGWIVGELPLIIGMKLPAEQKVLSRAVLSNAIQPNPGAHDRIRVG